MQRKRGFILSIIGIAVLLVSALAVHHHFQQVKIAEEQPLVIDEEQKKAEWTWLGDDVSFNQSMGDGLSIMYGPAAHVFADDKGLYVKLEHIKEMRINDISIAAFRMEPMQIEELYLEYQIYKLEQDEEVLVYRQYIPFPSNSLDPHTFYRYDFQVDYWDRDIFEKGQYYILRLKHSDTCAYYLAEMDFHGKISLVDNEVVRYDEYTIEVR